LFETFVN